MADDTTTDDTSTEEVEEEEVSEHQPTASEELEVCQANADLDTDTFEGATDSVPGAVTDLTPEQSKKAAKEEADIPGPLGADGWAVLADTDRVEELGATPGTLVAIHHVPMNYADDMTDIQHPQFTVEPD